LIFSIILSLSSEVGVMCMLALISV
jgi:hypothetical protein